MAGPVIMRRAFAPAVALKVIPTDQGRSELLGGGGDDASFDVVAMVAYDSGQIDYLVLHEDLTHPRWIGPNLVSRVIGA